MKCFALMLLNIQRNYMKYLSVLGYNTTRNEILKAIKGQLVARAQNFCTIQKLPHPQEFPIQAECPYIPVLRLAYTHVRIID